MTRKPVPKISDSQFTRVRNSLYKTRKMRVGISYLRVKNLETRKKLRVNFFPGKFVPFRFCLLASLETACSGRHLKC